MARVFIRGRALDRELSARLYSYISAQTRGDERRAVKGEGKRKNEIKAEPQLGLCL